MVELIEYIIVFGVSAGLAGASVMLVGQAMPGLNEIASTSKSDQLAAAARISIAEGRNVTLLLPVQDSSIACAQGTMTVSMAESTATYALAYPCSFEYFDLTGACNFQFASPADSLELGVKC